MADILEAEGRPTLVVPAAAAAPACSEDVLRALLRAIPDDRDVVLIAHSNAGLYAAPLTEHRRVVAGVFVDARLPPSAGVATQAPERFLDVLRSLADDHGLLPPWTAWWPEDDTASLFPDAETRAAVEQEQLRLPLSYFDDSVSAPPGWDEMPCAYLAFGGTYDAELQDAVRRGWPVRTLDGGHLHMLVEPGAVAAALATMLSDLDVR